MPRSAIIASALIMAAGAGLPAAAQTAAPDSEGGRYSLTRVGDPRIGEEFLRLDQRTGQVSVCAKRNLGWACLPIPDERSALEEEIGRLQKDNAALKKDMLARGVTPPGAKQTEQPVKPKADLELKLPSDAEIDRVVSMMERVWRRLVEAVSRWQKDISTRI